MSYTREQIEDFLYHEAALIDEWKTEDWANLFTEDAEYLIPPTENPDANKDTALFIINDDYHRLQQRAIRLGKRTAHAEFPHSIVRHMISNVRIISQSANDLVVNYNQVVYRSKRQITDTYICSATQHLVPDGDSFKIRSKRVILATDTLRPQGRVSIIL
ncbi:MAG: aromatic-ring-hydroxylating dioxygenase subunit beta [Porticoccaceae bacterium]|nr:aromatic-ring-hydroxylating dioxygenase subunit beta [Porticoccaceae bacterium]